MKALFALVVFAVLLWLSYGTVRANRQIEQDQKTIANLTAKQTALDETPSFDLQSRCADASKEFFKRLGYEPYQHADYQNHYNAKLRKCFIVVSTSDMKTTPGRVLTSKDVFDAVEGKSYGNYIWQSDLIKKYWEVAPLSCVGTEAYGTQKYCHSDGEFEALMSPYMDITN